ncbi:MAG: 3-methyl-2-oxobutanoate hydroxymethyltransferase [Thermodesulfobacteriota bacterium]
MRKSIQDLQLMKVNKECIVALTAYDYQTAIIVDNYCDFVLVGDSLGNVFQGEETTLGVTVDQMIYHGSIVSKAVKNAHLCIDMPFMSYQSSVSEALKNAGDIIKSTKAQSIKLEINIDTIPTIQRLSNAGIPVVAHVGLCPQSFNLYGGYKKQGKNKSDQDYILMLSKEAEKNGASIVVIEGVPDNLGLKITRALKIPTIGIGAGNKCDGQILVTEDMLGLTPPPYPSFVKNYSNMRGLIKKSVSKYKNEVKKNKFP